VVCRIPTRRSKAATPGAPPSRFHSAVAQRSCGPAGREQVVVYEDPRAVGERVGVHLKGIEAVLQRVLGAHGVGRKLARLARGDEPRMELAGERCSEDEAARLRGHHIVDRLVADAFREPGDGLFETVGVEQQRGDVAEQDSGPREVRDLPDQRPQIDTLFGGH
jgi:hypothetical protein